MPPKPTYKELELRIKKLEQDAHAHQETREQLRKNEELFHDLTETLPIPAVIGTIGLETLYLNPKFTEVFGFTAEDLPDQQAWRDKFFKDPEYLDKITQEVNDWIESGAKSTVFHRHYLDKWSKAHEVVVHIFLLKDRYYNFIEDVTEAKRSEESLKRNFNVLEQMVAERTEDLLQTNLRLKREIEERKRAEKDLKFTQFAVDHVSDAAFWLEPDGRIIYVNEAACRVLGYSKEELLELTVHDIDPNFPREAWPVHWENIKRQIFSIIESHHRTKDGKIFPVEISINYIEFDGMEYNCAFARNISERKQAEDALRESEERYRILFEQSPDAIFLDNLKDETVDANPAACKLMGYSRDELLKMTVADLQAPEVRGNIGEIVSSEMEQHGGIAFEGMNIKKDGSLIPVEIRTVPLTKGDLCLSIVRDITARKQAEVEKQKLEAQLQQMQKMEAISTLAGGIAHRFNNALSVIAGNIELIKLEFPDNEIVDEYTRPIRSSIHHLAQLTAQLLAYARGGKYKARTISPSNFVRDTLPLLNHTLKPNVIVETDLPFDILNVEADLTQLQMILSALLQNASEAIENRGRIRIICRNEDIQPDDAKNLPGLNPGLYVSLTIRDDGKGMDEDTKNRAFEPFFTKKFQGRGLGLAAVYGIVKNHNGWISIDSKLGSGTTVKIYLPAKFEDKKEQDSTTNLFNASGIILLVEDEEKVLSVNRALLEKLGYEVIVADTGHKAIETAQTFKGNIDIALLDIVLPDMQGKEIYSLIRDARPEMKVIVCSGYAQEGPVQEILNAGAHAFIQKPFTLKTLSNKLKEVITISKHEKRARKKK